MYRNPPRPPPVGVPVGGNGGNALTNFPSPKTFTSHMANTTSMPPSFVGQVFCYVHNMEPTLERGQWLACKKALHSCIILHLNPTLHLDKS
jgi:hypothetical protein